MQDSRNVFKAVDDYANSLEFVPDQYKTQEMCDKAVSEII